MAVGVAFLLYMRSARLKVPQTCPDCLSTGLASPLSPSPVFLLPAGGVSGHPDFIGQCGHPQAVPSLQLDRSGRDRRHLSARRQRGAIGSVFGALILRVISYFFRVFDITPLLQPLFEGIILLAAV
jgi:hypothetical protein